MHVATPKILVFHQIAMLSQVEPCSVRLWDDVAPDAAGIRKLDAVTPVDAR
jgi:hypothetical protein